MIDGIGCLGHFFEIKLNFDPTIECVLEHIIVIMHCDLAKF